MAIDSSLIYPFKIVIFRSYVMLVYQSVEWRFHGRLDQLLLIEVYFINRSSGDQKFIDGFVNICLWNG